MMNKQKKKPNFIPHMIIGGFMLFGMMIFTMVYGAFQQDINLVRPDYYAQEIKYGKRMEEMRRTADLGDAIKINYNDLGNQIEIVLPKKFDRSHVKGVNSFYRPSNSKLDFNVPLQLTATNRQILNTEHLQKGLWQFKLKFSYQDKKYFKTYPFIKKQAQK